MPQINTSSHALKQIASHLNNIFDGDPWYGRPMRDILESTDPGLVFTSPAGGTHTIAELVAHMITWREFAIRRMEGDTEYLPDQEGSFDWKRFSHLQTDAWNVLMNRLKSSQRLLLTLLHQSDDSLLEHQVAGKPYTFRYLLQGIIEHELYHLGQIAYINRMHEEKARRRSGFLRYSFRIFPYEKLSLLK